MKDKRVAVWNNSSSTVQCNGLKPYKQVKVRKQIISIIYTKYINIGGPVEYHTYKTLITIHPYGPALHKPVYCAYRSHDFNTHNSWAGQPHKHCTTSPLPINRWLSCCETVFSCWVTILWLFCKLFQQAGLRLQEKIPVLDVCALMFITDLWTHNMVKRVRAQQLLGVKSVSQWINGTTCQHFWL